VDEAAQLAALQYRVKFGDNRKGLSGIASQLRDYIPQDLVDRMSSQEWVKAIVAAYVTSDTVSSENAKAKYLSIISRWPTFGALFFNVRQILDANLPEEMQLALQASGISLIDKGHKTALAVFPYSVIAGVVSGGGYLRLRAGNRALELMTPLDFRIHELISSYTAHVRQPVGLESLAEEDSEDE
jgi:myosin-7